MSVHYTTSAGTATDGADYAETSGDLNFADGQLVRRSRFPLLTTAWPKGMRRSQLRCLVRLAAWFSALRPRPPSRSTMTS